jgi:galactose mutarotase-like enzyme
MSDRIVTIRGPGLSAEIDSQGAQLHALRDSEGRDLLWDGDPRFWTGRAPILFPIVGALNQGRYRLDGETYILGKHGFARTSPFALMEHTTSSATYALHASDETLAAYPFRFVLRLRFAIEGAALAMAATIENHDSRDMPASFGFHPALRWPLPYGGERGEHRIVFDEAEPDPIRRIDSHGLLRPQPEPTPVAGRELMLRDSLFEDDVVILDRVRSRGLTYGAPGAGALRIDFPGAPYLGLWMRPGADYLCIEPWHGIADPEGFDGDFKDKPGVFLLAPGEAKDCVMRIEALGYRRPPFPAPDP